jgi:hypothetical protein
MISINGRYLAAALAASAVLLTNSGCALRSPLMKAPLASVTVDSVDPTIKHQDLGPVEAKYCPGDEPLASTDKSNIGMLDEVIFRAQKDKGASYIREANFMTEGSCVVVEGIAMK